MTSDVAHLDASRTPAGDDFVRRHVGPGPDEIQHMLQSVGYSTLAALVDAAVPDSIRLQRPLALDGPVSEHRMLRELRTLASRNELLRSYIGLGYADCITPPVIRRCILESPGWYTAYTPYQPEIAQGRLEMLLNFQTVIVDLTGMDIANASLLDEATAAAEAMAMSLGAVRGDERKVYFVSDRCHPQTIAVVKTRARGRGIEVFVGDHASFAFDETVFGALVQYPDTEGEVNDFADFCEAAHQVGALVTVAADLLSLAVLRPPGEWGADVVVGSAQRFGVPLGYGGPHAAFFATRDEHKRRMPGRLVGVSKDAQGRTAVRLALQTREQHIRREKATSNICTAQVLLAVIAGAYAVYHGPEGLRRIAGRVYMLTAVFAAGLRRLGLRTAHESFFDTIVIDTTGTDVDALRDRALAHGVNLRYYPDGRVGVALDETCGREEVSGLWSVFAEGEVPFSFDEIASTVEPQTSTLFERQSGFLEHPVFHRYRSETELMRYLKRLESRDLSLTTSMIPLGSCTMKLNAAAEMLPITWPAFSGMHPFAPLEQTGGYQELIEQLGAWLCEITGFADVSFQPNAGSQGEYAGLLTIRKFQERQGEAHRDVCLIPASAHGTNPASAIMAGLEVVVVATDDDGNIDLDDLRAKVDEHADRLAALMVTYPSTHGIFEGAIRDVCSVVHAGGGQVYLDGANMNAMVGVCRPADFGADACHLNLHKTFSIPHGGGGPGMGPICVAPHLAPHLPDHPLVPCGGSDPLGTVSAAPWGSPSILPISWAYVRMCGAEGLRRATEVAILNANYIASRLDAHYPVLYRGHSGAVAHECIIDPRPLKATTGVTETDIAKRLMDYGFHAPTVSFPVPGTLMIEPTESESLAEIDRFCDALIAIRAEIQAIAEGRSDPEDNALKHAPHTADVVTSDDWRRPYPRSQAAYPSPWTRSHKFWPVVGRIDEPYGDRHLFCSCPAFESEAEVQEGS